MRSQTLFLAAAVLLAPAMLPAQDSPTSAGADARVQAAMAAAVKAGIPTSLLERKVAEGQAKGVSMDRIATGVEKRPDALTDARGAMVQGGLKTTTEGELSVAADAIQAGVADKAIADLSSSASVDTRVVAMAVLADLVAVGQTSDQALSRVQSALAQGVEALANLDAEFGGDLGAVDAAAGVGAAGVQVGAGTGARVELGTPR